MDRYEQLLVLTKLAFDSLASDEKYWIGLVGAPGSGKSTAARAIGKRFPESVTIIPMDGYHYYRKELDAMEDPQEAYARRGAPFTFNSKRFVDEIVEAKHSGVGLFPSFKHSLGDPVENDIELQPGKQVVIVEGNYLLLNSRPWNSLIEEVFQDSWFLDVPIEVCCQRVEERHIENGLSRKEAQRRVETNDGPNAELVIEQSMNKAGLIFRM